MKREGNVRGFQRSIIAAFATIAVLLTASLSANARFINFRGERTTWSNTGLGGGPPQPMGYVEIRAQPGFTGDIPGSEFISVSDVIYGSHTTLTWTSADLLVDASKISFENGKVIDINLVYNHEGTLLVLSGPPTPSWAIVNSPSPPGVPFPGFDDLDFFGARGDLSIEVTPQSPLSLDGAGNPQIPPTPPPAPPASASIEVFSGVLEYATSGGLFFNERLSELNAQGPFTLVVNLDWVTDLDLNIKIRTVDRLWFTNIDIDQRGVIQVGDEEPIEFTDRDLDPNQNGFTVLNGESFSLNQVEHSLRRTLHRLSRLCTRVQNNGLGVCFLRRGFFRNTLAFGLFNNPMNRIINILGAIDELMVIKSNPDDMMFSSAEQMGEDAMGSTNGELYPLTGLMEENMVELKSRFSGHVTFQALTVPILEE